MNANTLTPKQEAALLGCSTRKVYSLIAAGELDGHNVGRKKVIYPESVTAFQERNRFQAGGQVGTPKPQESPTRGAQPGLKHLRL